MSLADRLAEERVVRKGPPCRVHVILAGLNDRDRLALAAALADPAMGSGRILDDLRAEGYPLSRETLARHRRGDCACERYAT